jgi:hypothetical protein
MAVITNYTTLQQAVADYLARSDLTSFIPNFCQNWEERFFRDPKNYGPWMETAYSQNTSNGVIAVPNDFLAWKVVYAGSGARELDPVPLSQLYLKYPRGVVTGPPRWIARNAGNFEFGPQPDSAYAIAGTYYAKPTLIRSDSDGVNWLVTNAPDLMLYGALLEAEPFLKNDARATVWLEFYKEALRTYQAYITETSLSGRPLRAVVG